jgi:hypothetical protein
MTDNEIQQIRRRIDDIAEAAERLEELGAENDLPAVERTAKRIEGTVGPLDAHVPPELADE